MTDTDIIFQSGPLAVSKTMLRFKGRRYKLAHIENLILKRSLFWIAMALSNAVALFTMVNADLLYSYELLIMMVIALALPILSWPIGTLAMHSRTLSTSEGSITWLYGDLACAQEAVEQVLEQNEDLS